MTFSINTKYASRNEAAAALGVNPTTGAYDVQMPGSVRKFLLEALNVVKDGELVDVVANGHLGDIRSNRVTSCTILVTPIEPPEIRAKRLAAADALEAELKGGPVEGGPVEGGDVEQAPLGGDLRPSDRPAFKALDPVEIVGKDDQGLEAAGDDLQAEPAAKASAAAQVDPLGR